MLELFLKDLATAEKEIAVAIKISDFKKISYLAIKIKGEALYCYAAKIVTMMEDLYQAAEKKNKQLIQEIFQQFKPAFKEVADAVAAYEWE